MIVEPDFLSHWKTQLLINDLNDRCAPLYVIALWAHCQQRRSDSFTNLAPNALKAICRYEGEASKLRSALERCGFLDVEGEAVVVHGWGELNAKLIANWDNGKTGGRPRNPDSRRSRSGQYSEEPKPNRNPTETENGNTETQPKPIREDRIGEEGESVSARETLIVGQAREIVEAYPRKEKIASALTIVAGHLRDGESFDAMISGTRACAAVIRTKPSGAMNRYCPGAESFFLLKRWRDDPETILRQGNPKTGAGPIDTDDALAQLGGRAESYK